jgi:hypothetical protein
MKFLKLAWVIFRSLALIAIATWLLFEIKKRLVLDRAIISWDLFIAIAGGVFGIVFAIAAKMSMREVKKFKMGSDGVLPH